MFQPLVRCGNPACEFRGAPIPLPPAILPEIILYPTAQPTNISGVNVVCRDCGHWRRYTTIEWGEFPWPPKAGRIAFPTVWRVAMRCVYENCDLRAEWYLFDNSAFDSEAVLSFVNRAKPPIVCANNHALFPDATLLSVDKVAEF